MSLPCVRGGGRRGTSLTEGLLCTRESDPYTPSASHSFGTSLSEGGKRVGRSFSMRGKGVAWFACAAGKKRVLALHEGGSPLLFPQKSQHDFCGIPEQNAKKEKPDEFPHRAFPCYWTINQPDCS